jgi:hypothetical protein
LFIDESGEAGIRTVRSDSSSGASPYMTLGAALIHNSARNAIEDTLTNIASEFGKVTPLLAAESLPACAFYTSGNQAEDAVIWRNFS